MTLEHSSAPTHFTDATQEERLEAMEGVLANGVLPQLASLALSIKQGKLAEWADSVSEAWTEDAVPPTSENDEEPIAETAPSGAYF